LSQTDKTFLVRRTCTRRSKKVDEQGSFLLELFREKPAYVLLGDPGAGKTESFKREAIESGGEYIRARNFTVLGSNVGYHNKTLFIDGLDEMPAVDGDRRHPLDRIRERLTNLGKPRFRISCREADWLGESGSQDLKYVSPDGDIVALHLDPLNNDDIAEILRHKSTVLDPNEFMHKAQEHRLTELLRNPQTLNLLVDAVGGGEWPESRKQIYEMACDKLVAEKNLEHRQAKREKVISADALLDAAGYLSAVQLLSGMAGFALDEASADDQHCYWKELKEQSLPLLAALKTNLFQGDGEELRIPVHRSVAEFLGARYLATRIEHHGLPFGRVLALMTGEDGGVVTDLRGLASWLSVFSLSVRRTLIERDPLGVVLYGDVRDFSVMDKSHILEALKSEAQRYPWFRSEDWASSPFGALATNGMEPSFREILASPSREVADQALLDCVIDAIQHGERMPALHIFLERITRDASYQQKIRESAVLAWARTAPDSHPELLRLAEDIRTDSVEDRDDRILGVILNELYPNVIQPSQIFNYLHLPKQQNLIGSYYTFWVHNLPEKSATENLPILLDKLAQIRPTMRNVMESDQLNQMVGRMLVRGLEEHGDAVSDERLYGWLRIGLDEYDHPRLDREYTVCIQAWFITRPERYMQLIEYGAALCANQEDGWECMHKCERRFYGSTPPPNIGMWYLERAASEKQENLARYLFNEVVQLLKQQGGQRELVPIALEFLESWSAVYPKFQPWLEPYISCPIGDWQQDHAIKDRKWETDRQNHKGELLLYYRKHIEAIRNGSAYPQDFYNLALAHEGLFSNDARGETPQERMEDFLGNDQDLIEAAYSGFRCVLERKDLPTVGEIVELELKGKMHFIRSACLVGMDELFKVNPDSAVLLPDEVLSRLLAFRLSFATGNEPAWVSMLVKLRPVLVADVLLAYALPMLRAKKEHVSGLYQLANDVSYAEVARIALPKLLKGFPLRASANQLAFVLAPLLKSALHYFDRDSLVSLVSRKLELGSMDAAQKVYWLSCGLLLAPEEYEEKLFKHIGKSAARRGYLENFIYNNRDERSLPDWASLPISVLGRMIELSAPDSSPERSTEEGWVSPAMHTADIVRSYINTLGSNPSEVASHELERLQSLPKLTHWYNHLSGALHTQRIARRKASFKRLSVAEVGRTLANLQPASAADLAALTFDHLRDIARKIRDGSTDDYEQYWSYNENNTKLVKPKPENDCRNALLSDLKERLGKLNITADRESNYADDKRADIKVAFGGTNGFNVPIEIKKDSHDDIWRAIHEQLIPKYIRDPDSDGYGIYLVFWFDWKGMKPSPDGGGKIRSAQELEERLRQTLAPEESYRILICVIDCALPV
jgi:hypothetical protein